MAGGPGIALGGRYAGLGVIQTTQAVSPGKPPRLRWEVARKLKRNWSREQISGWLKGTFPHDEDMHLSTRDLPQLFIRPGCTQEGIDRAPSRGPHHAPRQEPRAYIENRGKIADAVSIRQRPAEVEDRAIPGHWEGDLLSGSNNTHIATLVERQTRFTMLVKGRGRTPEASYRQSAGKCADSDCAAPVPDLGSWQRNGGPQTVHDRHRCRCLFLRSPQPMARARTRTPTPAAPVLPKGTICQSIPRPT